MNVSNEEGNIVEVDGDSPESYPHVYEYSKAEDVTLEAIPAEGYAFQFWRGCISSSLNPLKLTVDSAKSVTAYFSYSGKPNGTVQGRLWNDRDKDGIQEASSVIENFPAATVELRKADGALVSTALAENGYYRFEDVEYGQYYVFFDVPSPYLFTLKDQGSDTADSDTDGTGKTDFFVIGQHTENISMDAGVYESGRDILEVSVAEAAAIAAENPGLLVVDVREPEEFCEGHIENALNMPWNSGYFIQNYMDLPPDSDILLVCRSGHRSRHAAEFLCSVGYDLVYNMAAGMNTWDLDVLKCYKGIPLLFYQHVAASGGFDTEIGIVNASEAEQIVGTFRGYDKQGNFVSESAPVELKARARRAFTIRDFLQNAASISFIVFESERFVTEEVVGYTKYFFPGGYSSAVPASKVAAAGDVHIPHIASDSNWATGIALLNTEPVEKKLEIRFDGGLTKAMHLPAFGHRAFTIASLFGKQPPKNPDSAVIKNSAGIMALELFGRMNNSAYGTVLLSDSSSNVLAFPLIAENEDWWTGFVAYNTSEQPCNLTIIPYTAEGKALTEQAAILEKHERYIGTRSSLGLPPETGHLQIQGSQQIAGFMLVGKGDRIGGSEYIGLGRKKGVLPRLEKNGWTSIVLLNHENEKADVTLEAFTDGGARVASQFLRLNAHEQKKIDLSDFFNSDIREASYIFFSANKDIGALQFNGSEDGRMFDLLPAL